MSFAFDFSPMNYACCEDCRIAPKGKPCIEDISDNLDCLKGAQCKYPFLKIEWKELILE